MAGVPIRALRFDPLTAEGRLELRQIRIVDANRMTRHVVPLAALHAANQIAALETKGDHTVIRTIAGANDPITEFDAAEVQVIAGLTGSSAVRR